MIALLLLASMLGAQAESPLLEAARLGDVDRARALLESGADVDEGNRYGATALFFAADRGHLEMARLLVSRGASVNLADSFYQMTPTSRAQMSGHEDVVLFLLAETEADPDPVLVAAARSGDAELVRAALQTGRVTRAAFDEAAALASGDAAALLEEAEPPAAAERAERWSPGPAELERFAGRYQEESTEEIVEIVVRDGGLLLNGRRLEPDRTDVFTLPDGTEVAFGGRGGMVERMALDRNGTRSAYRPYEEEAESAAPSPEAEPDVLGPGAAWGSARRGAPRPWSAFRGSDRSGNADGQGIPLTWDGESGKNVRFRTAIPGFSVASPILWGDRIFVVTAVSGADDRTFRIGLYGDVRPVDDLSEHRWLLLALDAASGEVVWERELHRGVPGTKRHTKSSQANETPVTDGEHLVTLLGSVGQLACHDLAGNLHWKKDIGVLNAGWFYDPDYQWGHSSSPILYEDLILLQADVHGGSYLAAYSLETGEEVWRTERPDEIPTFSTPTVYRGASGDELVTNGTVIRGYDPRTGKLLWHLGPNSELPVGSPVVTEDLIFVTAGYPPVRPIYAIRPGSRGDLSLPDGVEKSEALAWSKSRGGTYIPTPLAYRGHFYTNAINGRLTCYDADTGEIVYRERIGGVGGSFSASPIAADGRLYFTNEDGETFVVEAGPEYRLLAKNSVGGVVLATPAASNGLLVIRTLEHVYGIAE